MGRSPCCDGDANLKKGPWTQEEDNKLTEYIEKNGCGSWKNLPKLAGLNRCGKSCRLRWTNYLRPDIKRGKFSEEEDRLIIHLHSVLGNKWSAIAARLQGRTDNEIKNYWNTHLRKKLLTMGIDPVTHRPRTDLNLLAALPNLIAATSNMNNLATNPLINNALQLQKLQLFQTLIQAIAGSTSPPSMDPMALLGLTSSSSSSSSFLDGSMINPLMSLNSFDPSFQPLMNYGSTSSDQFDVENTSAMTTTPTNSTPCSVSVTPENSTVDQEQGTVNTKIDASASSSPTSTPPLPFYQDGVGLTLDDLDIDLGWKDILDQISWSDSL